MSMPQKKPRFRPMPSVEELVRDLIAEPDRWLDTENDQLGGKKPRELLKTEQEPLLRNLLEAIQHGSFS